MGLVIYFGGFLTGLLNIIDYGVLGSIAAVISLFAAVSIDRGKEDVPKSHVISEDGKDIHTVTPKMPYERICGSFLSYFAFIYILINYFPLVYGKLCNFEPIFGIPFIIIAFLIMIIELINSYYHLSHR